VKWWRVIVRVEAQQYQLDTTDPAKIGPWLTDIVDSLRLPEDRSGFPFDLNVTIS